MERLSGERGKENGRSMNNFNFPDFSHYGYQVESELGKNLAGGRVTYLARDSKTSQPVVIKQFQFAKSASSWSGYDAYSREIQVLQGLNHPGIAHYIDGFETLDSFCMVQSYKNAPSLAVPRSFTPDEIKEIAVSVLEILVYLQNRIPSVIHRDIKPENILVDEQINVYLVDFGFARIGEGEVAMSSMVKGTLGFMPPEQLFNRQLTEASDLYGLGATLICLLTGTKSTAIGNLIDESSRIHFQHLVPKLSRRWIDWLQKMVEPQLKYRYPNAATALEALRPIYVIRLPSAKFSESSIEFTATQLNETLTQVVTITNSVPETLLEGTWEVAPHLSDPPHTPDSHNWISFEPAKFASNWTECKIIVDTSRLMADRHYSREVLLHTNSSPETQCLAIQVQTAAIPIKTKKLPYGSLVMLLLFAWAMVASAGTVAVGAGVWAMVLGAGVVVAGTGALAALTTGVDPWVGALAALASWAGFGVWAGAGLIAGAGVVGLCVAGIVIKIHRQRGFGLSFAIGISFLTTVLGISLGMGFKLGLLNPLVVLAVAGTTLPLAAMMIYPPLRQARLVAKYRQSEQQRLEP